MSGLALYEGRQHSMDNNEEHSLLYQNKDIEYPNRPVIRAETVIILLSSLYFQKKLMQRSNAWQNAAQTRLVLEPSITHHKYYKITKYNKMCN